MFSVVILILVSLLLPGGSCLASETVERVLLILPERAEVQGRELILGEIAEIAGPWELVSKVSEVNAGAAPGAGYSRRLTKAQIEVRLRQAKLDLSLVEFQGSPVVQVFGALPPVQEPEEATGGSGSMRQAAVAVRDLPRGTVIAPEDVRLEDSAGGNAEDSADLEDFLGLRTTRLVRVGVELTLSHVEEIPQIERGDSVLILVQTSSLSVSAPGTAKGSGNVGQIISVENSVSRKVVQATIVDEQTVKVKIRGSGAP